MARHAILRLVAVRSMVSKSHFWEFAELSEFSGAGSPDRSGALKSAAWRSNRTSGNSWSYRNSRLQAFQIGQGRSSPQHGDQIAPLGIRGILGTLQCMDQIALLGTRGILWILRCGHFRSVRGAFLGTKKKPAPVFCPIAIPLKFHWSAPD